jgi:hypothetical protein
VLVELGQQVELLAQTALTLFSLLLHQQAVGVVHQLFLVRLVQLEVLAVVVDII